MNNDYKKFLDSLTGLFSKIENTLDDSDRRQTALSYWTVGKKVYEYSQESGVTAKQVALDLGSSPGSVQHYVRFFKLYPKGYPEEYFGHVLGWSDFRAVLAVHDQKKREWYLKQACRQDWGSHELRRRVSNNFYENVSHEPSAMSHELRTLEAKEQKLYTYAARVLKVIDADTLKVEVDVGFSMRYETKVRLRGINCPEKKTKKGQEAKKFVEEELRFNDPLNPRSPEPQKLLGNRGAGALVALRTYKSGKYGRFIADVWYLKDETDPEEILKKGKLLNQALLDQGYAQRV